MNVLKQVLAFCCLTMIQFRLGATHEVYNQMPFEIKVTMWDTGTWQNLDRKQVAPPKFKELVIKPGGVGRYDGYVHVVEAEGKDASGRVWTTRKDASNLSKNNGFPYVYKGDWKYKVFPYKGDMDIDTL